MMEINECQRREKNTSPLKIKKKKRAIAVNLNKKTDSGGSNTLAVYASKPNLTYKCLTVKKLKPKEN